MAAESVATLSYEQFRGVEWLLLALRDCGAPEKSTAARGISFAPAVSDGLERTDLYGTLWLRAVSAPNERSGQYRLVGSRYPREFDLAEPLSAVRSRPLCRYDPGLWATPTGTRRATSASRMEVPSSRQEP